MTHDAGYRLLRSGNRSLVRRILLMAGILAVAALFGPSAHACTCAEYDTAQWRDIADAVFEGRYEGRTFWIFGDAVFTVTRAWKGAAGKRFFVEWKDGSAGDCRGFWREHLIVGEQLLVFASRDAYGGYHTSICFPTQLVRDASGVIRELGPANRRRSGTGSGDGRGDP